MKRSVFIVCLFSLFALCSQACAAVVEVSVELTLVSLSAAVDDLGYRQGNKWEKIVVPELNYSPTYRYSGPAKMDLYRVTSAAATPVAMKGDKPAAPLVGSVTFDPAVRRAVVLLVATGGKYTGLVLPAALEDLPAGQVMLLNLTPSRLAVRCNQAEVLLLSPREHKVVAAGGHGELDAEIAREKEGAWRRVQRNFVPVLPHQQTVIVLTQNSAGWKGIELIALRQTPKSAELASVGR